MQQIDHMVIVVKDLDTATKDFESLGFQVKAGGKHSSGRSHNALVGFNDGAYFELYAFIGSGEGGNHRWWEALERGGGFSDFCLAADNLKEDAARANAAGLNYTPPFDMGRQRPDGQMVEWILTSAPRDGATFMPFMIEDKTPRSLRVPTGDEAVHPNGVNGVAEVVVAVKNVDAAAAAYKALLGLEPSGVADVSGLDAKGVTFKLGNQSIVLAQPNGDGSPLAAHLKHHGTDFPYRIALRSSDESKHGVLDQEKAGNSRISIVG